MKKVLLAVLVVMCLLGSFASNTSYAFGNVTCPHCGIGGCMWTGETQSDAYGIFLVYECLNGHRFLMRQ